MGNNYEKWDEEKRKKWNRYSANYNKKHYRQFSVQLNTDTDAELITYLESHKPINRLFRKLIQEQIKREK